MSMSLSISWLRAVKGSSI